MLKKVLLCGAATVAALILLLVIVVAMQPAEFHIGRSAKMAAPALATLLAQDKDTFVRRAAEARGLRVIEPVQYGVQDLIILTKEPLERLELGAGWHALARGLRWTESSLRVRMAARPAVQEAGRAGVQGDGAG